MRQRDSKSLVFLSAAKDLSSLLLPLVLHAKFQNLRIWLSTFDFELISARHSSGEK
jgi:hypothetical protein